MRLVLGARLILKIKINSTFEAIKSNYSNALQCTSLFLGTYVQASVHID